MYMAESKDNDYWAPVYSVIVSRLSDPLTFVRPDKIEYETLSEILSMILGAYHNYYENITNIYICGRVMEHARALTHNSCIYN